MISGFGNLFSFDANTETPQDAERRRQLAAMIMGRPTSPQNVGEGFGAIANGIVAAVNNSRASQTEQAGRAGADSTFNDLVGMLTGQGAALDRHGTAGTSGGALGAANAVATGAPSDFMSSLVANESGGNWGALNDHGYGGRLQFGDARLEDAARAGIVPQGMTGARFSQLPPEDQMAVEAWHFADIDRQAERLGLNQYIGQTIGGVTITPDAIRAMAHLGGIDGARRFIETGGQYNPADANGTRLSDYGQRHGGFGTPQQPTQVASLDPSIGMPPPATNPATGFFDPGMNMGQAGAALAPPAPPMQPAQTAQAQGPDLRYLMEAAQNPWLNEGQRATVNALIAQELQRMDPRYQQQLAQGNVDLQRSQFELNQMMNPAPAAPQYEIVNGEVVWLDPSQQSAVSGGQFGAPDMTTAIQNYQFLVGNGVDPETAMERAFSGGVNVNVGDQGQRIGSVPPGMAVVPDSSNPSGFRMETIPGSPAALEAEQSAAQAEMRGAQTGRYADVVLDDIDRALGLTGGDTTGLMGTLLQNVPGTNSRNLDALLQTIRSNIGFDRLQSMREASPTGGALGAVSDFENRQLQSTLGNLEQSQTEEQLRRNLERVRETYLDIIHGPGNRPGIEGSSAPDWVNADEPPQGWTGDTSLWRYLTPEQRNLWEVR